MGVSGGDQHHGFGVASSHFPISALNVGNVHSKTTWCCPQTGFFFLVWVPELLSIETPLISCKFVNAVFYQP